MHTPNLPQNDSPQGEFSELPQDELEPQYNPATSDSVALMDEEEWLYLHSIFTSIEPQYNPVTMDFAEPDAE